MVGFWGEVIGIIEETKYIQFLFIHIKHIQKTIHAIHYVYLDERCTLGDMVKVNISAIQLQLGTGGYGFVIAKSPHQEKNGMSPRAEFPGHIIKLRYTPYQTPILACEAPESKFHSLFNEEFHLQGKHVFLGELHSMLPIMVSLLKHWDAKRKIVYIMDDQAALYSSFSNHIRYLQEKADLTAITYGQALGGDLECINLYTALEAAVKIAEADDIIITQGPGVVGSRTERGFSGMQLVHWIHAVHTCGGQALIIPRIQFADKRFRHFGLSEHTLYPLLHHVLAPAVIPYPVSVGQENAEDDRLTMQTNKLKEKHEVIAVQVEEFKQDIEKAMQWYGKPIKTMGRDYTEDPYFFYAVGASFQLYKERNSSIR